MVKYIIITLVFLFFGIASVNSNNTVSNLSKKYEVSFTKVDYDTRKLITDTLSNIDNRNTYIIWEETIVNLIKEDKVSTVNYIIDIGIRSNKKQATVGEIHTLITIMKEHSTYANDILKDI